MKSAYLYCRISTDEQKRKGCSLEEQEDRLIKYCEMNGIHIIGIFHVTDYQFKLWQKVAYIEACLHFHVTHF